MNSTLVLFTLNCYSPRVITFKQAEGITVLYYYEMNAQYDITSCEYIFIFANNVGLLFMTFV
jgi:hypothetical protein